MNISGKYKNYDLHPYRKIEGYEEQAWEGMEAVSHALKESVQSLQAVQKRVVLNLDWYPGADREELLGLGKSLAPCRLFDMEEYAKSEELLNQEFQDFITDDRVFGVLCHKTMDTLFDREKLRQALEELEQIEEGLVVIAGVGTGFLYAGDISVHCSVTRWEIQLRYRSGMPNWHCTNGEAPVLTKYKRGFFIEWRLADRYKKARYDAFDYFLDSDEPGNPKMVTGEAYRAALDKISREPFRMEPYFDPGVWGGHWMQENFGLDSDRENFAWSFDGVPEENSIHYKFGDVMMRMPAIDLVLYRPHELLGERVHARFGAEFPIRFDLLDTMGGGGNLSLQVHPLTEYIQDTFGMHYTQDESYYILDADEQESCVYLGVKKHVDQEAMAEDLRRAEKGEIAFPAERYVNKVPVKKHDHVLISAGTIHCSGKNTMVLEISATPYIFTFKLWDWGRVGLDGVPRPIHVEHGLKNIDWNRDTDWIYDNLIHQEQTIRKEEGILIERTGLHNREFIDTIRYTLTKPAEVWMDDSVHVMNLVDGRSAFIESTDGSFEPFAIHYAENVIVPAKAGRYRIVPAEGEIKLIAAMVRR